MILCSSYWFDLWFFYLINDKILLKLINMIFNFTLSIFILIYDRYLFWWFFFFNSNEFSFWVIISMSLFYEDNLIIWFFGIWRGKESEFEIVKVLKVDVQAPPSLWKEEKKTTFNSMDHNCWAIVYKIWMVLLFCYFIDLISFRKIELVLSTI